MSFQSYKEKFSLEERKQKFLNGSQQNPGNTMIIIEPHQKTIDGKSGPILKNNRDYLK